MAKLLHFTCGGWRFALPVAHVREISEIQTIEPVPGAPPVIAGLMEIRGRIVTLVALTEAGRSPARADGPRLAVLLAEPHDHLGVLVRGAPQSVEAEEIPEDSEAPEGGAVTERELAPLARAWAANAGRQVLLPDGRWATLLDAAALSDECTRRVRQRYRRLR